MQIQYKNNPILNISDWENNIFTGKKAVHWKQGRSAYSLADYLFNKNGIVEISKTVASCLNVPVVLNEAIPEHEVRFDSYGHGREHDLAIWGTAGNNDLFIGVEAKVDEPFGDTIGGAYLKAKCKELAGEKTNAPKRIEKLLLDTFIKPHESDFNLRYQLLYSLAATLTVDVQLHVLMIIVFKTHLYNPQQGMCNETDFCAFVKRIRAVKVSDNHFRACIGGKDIHFIYKEIS